ncbi:MAG TPA: spermidine/putrescine ABC transporter permease PotC, partial [Myxococcota bacterium]|nr:spermidine/putrescine ABC transporter permease PotC [Myxococcota bacterium]
MYRVFGVWTGVVFAFFYLPIAILILFSFNESRLNIVWTGFTLEWYGSLFGDRTLVRT